MIELTATGGVVILSIAFILLDLKRIRTAKLAAGYLYRTADSVGAGGVGDRSAATAGERDA